MTAFLLNGVPLKNFAQVITTGDGLQSAAGILGANIELPGMDGAFNPYDIGQQRRPDGEGRFVVALSMKGIDPDTGAWLPGTTEQTYLDNCDDMVRRWYSRALVVDAVRPDATVRRMRGHLVPGESLDFTRERSSPAYGTYVASVAIPSGRWTDVDPVTTGVQTLASGANLNLSAFAAATAVCTDLQVVLHGGRSNPRLDTAVGYFASLGAIAGGRQLRAHTRTGVLDRGTGAVWTPSYVGTLDYSPGPRYFEIDPGQPLEATLTFDGGGTMDVEITGPRHYRTH